MFLNKDVYVFGSQATGKTVSLSGETINEYLSAGKYNHTFMELWGSSPIISCLFHKSVQKIDYITINDYDYDRYCDDNCNYDDLGWELKAKTFKAVLAGECPPSQALFTQGWVVDIIADLILFASTHHEDFEQNLDWILLEIEELIPSDMFQDKKMVNTNEGYVPYPYNVEAFNFLRSTYTNADRNNRLILVPEHHIIF